MSNGFTYWSGQPVNSTVYPQMGDLMQSQTGGGAGAASASAAAAAAAGGFGAVGWPGPTATTSSTLQQQRAQSSAATPGPYPSAGAAGHGVGQGGGNGGGNGGNGGNGSGGGMAMQSPNGQVGMGDYGTVSAPLTCNLPTNFFGQGQGPFEPCIDNGEAFCAYNGINYGGGQGKGSFW